MPTEPGGSSSWSTCLQAPTWPHRGLGQAVAQDVQGFGGQVGPEASGLCVSPEHLQTLPGPQSADSGSSAAYAWVHGTPWSASLGSPTHQIGQTKACPPPTTQIMQCLHGSQGHEDEYGCGASGLQPGDNQFPCLSFFPSICPNGLLQAGGCGHTHVTL